MRFSLLSYAYQCFLKLSIPNGLLPVSDHANYKEIQKIYYTMAFLLHTFCYKHRPHPLRDWWWWEWCICRTVTPTHLIEVKTGAQFILLASEMGKGRSKYMNNYTEKYMKFDQMRTWEKRLILFSLWRVLKHFSWSLKTFFPFFSLLPFFSFS
jgi:hypothetical protein